MEAIIHKSLTLRQHVKNYSIFGSDTFGIWVDDAHKASLVLLTWLWSFLLFLIRWAAVLLSCSE